MKKTLLVIGTVRSAQYREAQFAILRQGHKPQVVRVSAEEFFLDAEDLDQEYATPRQLERLSREALCSPEALEGSTKLTAEFASQHIAQYPALHSLVLAPDVMERYESCRFIKHALAEEDCMVWALEGENLLIVG